jgi:hypothetical protein
MGNSDGAIEVFFTPQELAERWKVHPSTIQRIFMDEPGVMKLGRTERRNRKRQYVTLRIPASVALRVYERKSR